MSNLEQNAQNFTGNDESGSGQIRNFFSRPVPVKIQINCSRFGFSSLHGLARVGSGFGSGIA